MSLLSFFLPHPVRLSELKKKTDTDAQKKRSSWDAEVAPPPFAFSCFWAKGERGEEGEPWKCLKMGIRGRERGGGGHPQEWRGRHPLGGHTWRRGKTRFFGILKGTEFFIFES